MLPASLLAQVYTFDFLTYSAQNHNIIHPFEKTKLTGFVFKGLNEFDANGETTTELPTHSEWYAYLSCRFYSNDHFAIKMAFQGSILADSDTGSEHYPVFPDSLASSLNIVAQPCTDSLDSSLRPFSVKLWPAMRLRQQPGKKPELAHAAAENSYFYPRFPALHEQKNDSTLRKGPSRLVAAIMFGISGAFVGGIIGGKIAPDPHNEIYFPEGTFAGVVIGLPIGAIIGFTLAHWKQKQLREDSRRASDGSED